MSPDSARKLTRSMCWGGLAPLVGILTASFYAACSPAGGGDELGLLAAGAGTSAGGWSPGSGAAAGIGGTNPAAGGALTEFKKMNFKRRIKWLETGI